MDQVFTYLLDLPPAVKGVVHPCGNGDYTIYINSRYNEHQRYEIFQHEVRHILLGHFDDEHTVLSAAEQAAATPAPRLQPHIQSAAGGLLPPVHTLPTRTSHPVPLVPAEDPLSHILHELADIESELFAAR